MNRNYAGIPSLQITGNRGWSQENGAFPGFFLSLMLAGTVAHMCHADLCVTSEPPKLTLVSFSATMWRVSIRQPWRGAAQDQGDTMPIIKRNRPIAPRNGALPHIFDKARNLMRSTGRA